ncbi:hypothetical protein [Paenibacillus sp. YYML68]|uniref:hypothetical protein n=1 Tax=Paenibacillus sp. YYML68 TaxID=2909250 RepID=UPI002491BD5C|nr:hypothetical protein [Paenibacillus sp. YYML68]
MWLYLIKTQSFFLLLPVWVCVLAIALRDHESISAYNVLAYVGIVMVPFPAAGLMHPVGSLHQKELFTSLPLSNRSLGFIQPFTLAALYGIMYSVTLNIVVEDGARHLTAAIFTSVMLLFVFTCMFISLLKNSAIGLCLALIYVIFGMFTTGTGQGVFYLFQWFRPKPYTDPQAFVVYQIIGTIVLGILNYWLVKRRNRLHWLQLG